MEWINSSEALLALLTLTIMEVVLGIDNIVFISIQTDKLPKDQQKKGRLFGLLFALVTRVTLLLSITWVMTLTKPLFNLADLIGLRDDWIERFSISGRDLILFFGGLFLLYKGIIEIYNLLEGSRDLKVSSKRSFLQTIIQIGLLDIVFGLDSVITAIGMASHIEIMIIAVVIAMLVMVFSIHTISDFVNKHPSVKVLALSFLLLIGVSLIAESIDEPIAKGYIYFSMGFSIFVIMLVIRLKPTTLPKE